MDKKATDPTAQATTRRSFGRKAYMVPAVLAAIKATETVAGADAPAPMTVSGS